MLYGGSLIGRWCVGLILIVGSLAFAGDALLRESASTGRRQAASTHEQVIERWRAAR
jgi:hypothetical protein